MQKKSALEIYTTESLNCAQSILKGYKDEYEISEEKIAAFTSFGGGRAKDNMCGALYAAVELIEDSNAKENMIAEFSDKTGSTKCREIRREGKISCKECVRIASELVENLLQNV